LVPPSSKKDIKLMRRSVKRLQVSVFPVCGTKFIDPIFFDG
jgi:hypothetical protein